VGVQVPPPKQIKKDLEKVASLTKALYIYKSKQITMQKAILHTNTWRTEGQLSLPAAYCFSAIINDVQGKPTYKPGYKDCIS